MKASADIVWWHMTFWTGFLGIAVFSGMHTLTIRVATFIMLVQTILVYRRVKRAPP